MGGLDATGAFIHRAQTQHDAAALVRLCAERFLAAGYSLTGQGPGWLSAMRGVIYAPGSAFAQAHTVVVRSDGWNVAFEIRGQYGFGFLHVPELTTAACTILAAYDSMVVHQALVGPPSSRGGYPPAPQSQAVPVSTHIIEKHVVVVRCKFCQAHTPVDAVACKACGAAKFS